MDKELLMYGLALLLAGPVGWLVAGLFKED